MSAIMPFGEMVTLSTAPADQFAFSAFSISGTRITPFDDAPVAATRTSPDLVLATNTPVRAKRAADHSWSEVRLPLAPNDPLDDVFYSGPSLTESSAHFVKVSAAPTDLAELVHEHALGL